MTNATKPAVKFDTVLIANRGEIAVRVIRSAKAAGYRTVAVFSDADADAPHVRLADLAVHLGPAPARESYLDIAKVIAAAQQTGAGAIHPGYGFLAENAAFAEACAEAGIVFIGPSADAIRLMGDKAAAKRLMAQAEVPLLPGYQGEEQSDERLVAESEAVGFPMMVKAAAGGGGKGMRLVNEPGDLTEAIAAARREATSAFGSDVLILERALVRPRHVEIQVLADTHGHTIALGERDCSVQRRHQKVVEESPSPALDAATRTAMQDAAVAAARAVDYVGAGTVEFLLGEDGTFAFLEMNTRLQVEHPVTEMVTGVDLVDWQLRIAAGAHLTIEQDDVTMTGHAIEVRLYAEDAAAGFLPQTGDVLAWDVPSGPGVRVDSGVDTGSVVSANYDPMLAKVIAHGRDRDEARRRLVGALEDLTCLGVTTNRGFLAWILRDPVFVAGEATTAFLDTQTFDPPPPTATQLAAAATVLHFTRQDQSRRRSPGLAGWSNASWLTAPLRLQCNGHDTDVRITAARDHATVTIDGMAMHVQRTGDGVIVGGQRISLLVHAVSPSHVHLRLADRDLEVIDVLHAAADTSSALGEGTLVAPMHGVVTSVAAAVGDQVTKGDAIVVMEAMKMEHVVRADMDGKVIQVVALATQVASGDVLATIEPAHASPDTSG